MCSGQFKLGVSAFFLILAACGGEATGLARLDGFPCTLSFEPVGVVIRTDPGSTHPFPYPPAVRNSRGDYYTASANEGVLLWSADGEYQGTLARVGSGEAPGEITGGVVTPLMTPGDTLMVRDNRFHWVVFGPDNAFVRKVPLGPIQVLMAPNTTHVLPDGTLLSTWPRTAEEGFAFALLDRSGTVLSKLPGSEAVASTSGGSGTSLARASSLDGDGGFWVGPVEGSPTGYHLEHWSLDGTLLDSLTRPVSWFKVREPRRVPLPGFALQSAVQTVHYLPNGLLWVSSLVLPPDWTEAHDDIPREDQHRIRYDELIDPVARRVLASVPRADNDYISLFTGSSEGYRMYQDSLGAWELEMVRLRIDGPENIGCMLSERADAVQ